MNVKVDIEMKNLWDDFYSLGTEMIVTKAGRSVTASHLLLLLYFTHSHLPFPGKFMEIWQRKATFSVYLKSRVN